MNSKNRKPAGPQNRSTSVSLSPSSRIRKSAAPRLKASGWILGLLLAAFPAGCMPVRNLLQPIRALAGDTSIQTNLSYRPESKNPRHELDLFLPGAENAPRGLVLFVHGGFWTNQDRRYMRPVTGLYWNIGYGLARAGYATAVLSYRISPEAAIADQLADVQSALRWAGDRLDTWNVAGDRLFLMGHSAGGHLVCMAALETPEVPLGGVVALAPVLDIAHMRDAQPADFNKRVTEPVFGAAATAAELKRWSPGLRWTANAKSTPLLVITGENDYAFLKTQAAEFAARASGRSPGVRFDELPELNHADLVLEFDADPSPVLPPILEFLADPAGSVNAGSAGRVSQAQANGAAP